ncbi:hypothetical protein NVV95_01240 [Herbiconiux sp. CPCC 205716]|uniref:Uncharacterized protein n=1 Tax=Herbiconiux gentiana TaxID=2970912 RepID=A0ABT2GAJ6_9MICO|nr:hypothetical protein [Herbiconiux gentiana]
MVRVWSEPVEPVLLEHADKLTPIAAAIAIDAIRIVLFFIEDLSWSSVFLTDGVVDRWVR